MEPEIIAAMGTIIVAMAAAIGKMLLDARHNNVPRDNHPSSNPGPVDLRTTKLGDMSAAWFEDQHKEVLTALENLTNAVKGIAK